MGRWGPAAVVVALGIAVRALALVASGPISLYLNDSRDYLTRAADLRPDGYHPLGYPLALRLLGAARHPLLLAVLQHGLGIAVGVAVAALALRAGLPGWGAALAAAPALLDPIGVVTEQFVLAETVFTALVVAAVALVVRHRWAAAAPVLAAATLTRTVALGLIAVLAVALLAGRPGWRTTGLAAAGLLLPLALYAGWFASHHGSPGLSQRGGIYLYGRMAPFADCAATRLPAADASLCDPRPRSLRPDPNFYLWHPEAPLKALPGTDDQRAAAAAVAGRRMLAAAPLTWARSTAGYLAHYLSLDRSPRPVDSTALTWQPDLRHSTAPPVGDPRLADGYRVTARVSPGATRLLRSYAGVVRTPAPLLAVLLAAGALASRWTGPSPARRTFVVAAAAGLVLLAVPSATVGSDLRFLVPALPLLGLAGAIAPALCRDALRRRRPTRGLR